MPYNLTGLMMANSTVEYISSLSDLISWFPLFLVVSMFAMFMLNYYSADITVLMLAAGFTTTIITGMLWLSGTVSFVVFVFPVVITTIAAIIVGFTANK